LLWIGAGGQGACRMSWRTTCEWHSSAVHVLLVMWLIGSIFKHFSGNSFHYWLPRARSETDHASSRTWVFTSSHALVRNAAADCLSMEQNGSDRQ
jgi:hypothetical protein